MAEGNETSREDRQLPATEKRLREARENGNVPRSRELGHAAVLGTAFLGLTAAGPWMGERLLDIVRGGLRFDRARAFEPQRALEQAGAIGGDALAVVVPVAAALGVAGAAATMALSGLVITTKPLAPDFSRINPASGLGRLFSRDGAIDLVKLLLLATVLAVVAAWFLKGRMPALVQLGATSLPQGLAWSWSMLRDGLAWLIGVLAFAALLDAPLQWFRHRANLRMTLEEVKKEHKESEGDPHVKGQIRQRQREMSRARMLAAVPTADVVVTNPTHYAVALRYDEASMGAPRVVAKGVDHLAAKIREAAQGAGVPMLEAPPLARALYAHAEVDQEIPAALYTAVAQVLAWVFQLRHAVPGRGRAPQAPAGIEVPEGMDPRADGTDSVDGAAR